jgi:hypothetical protein
LRWSPPDDAATISRYQSTVWDNIGASGRVGPVFADCEPSGGAKLGSNLCYANLDNADLSEAYLPGTRLTRAKLLEANLTGTILSNTNLSGVDLGVPISPLQNSVGRDLTVQSSSGRASIQRTFVARNLWAPIFFRLH